MLRADFINALFGGALIGLAAAGMFFANGRIMGVSGIIGGLLHPKKNEILWRLLFLAGIMIGGTFIPKLGFSIMELPIERGITSALIGGFFVGIGTTLGSGCTSGHGVCGISRLSPRSIVATIIFIAFGIISVSLFRFFNGAI